MIKQISRKSVIEEINHLFWIPEQLNNGNWDCGWNCREHAWLVVLLCKAIGLESSYVMNGLLLYHTPSSKKAESQPVLQLEHSWVEVEDIGVIDLSPKPSGKLNGDFLYGNPFPLKPVFCSKVLESKKGKVHIEPYSQYTTHLNENLRRRYDRYNVVFAPQSKDEVLPIFITDACDYINSPLTDILRKGSLSMYSKAFLHIYGLMRGERTSLRQLAWPDAWVKLDQDIHKTEDEVLRITNV